MRGWLILGAVVTIALTGVGQASTLRLQNDSGIVITQLYISPVVGTDWGKDQLGDREEDVISAHSGFVLSNVINGVYDIKIVMANGSACIVRNVDIQEDMTWELSDDILKTC
jgi:hypothetical protein